MRRRVKGRRERARAKVCDVENSWGWATEGYHGSIVALGGFLSLSCTLPRCHHTTLSSLHWATYPTPRVCAPRRLSPRRLATSFSPSSSSSSSSSSLQPLSEQKPRRVRLPLTTTSTLLSCLYPYTLPTPRCSCIIVVYKARRVHAVSKSKDVSTTNRSENFEKLSSTFLHSPFHSF